MPLTPSPGATTARTQAARNRTRAARMACYLLVAIAMSWPLILRLDTHTSGFPNIDSMDTIMLRGLITAALSDPLGALSSGVDRIYFPVGYPVLQLTPNLLDHLSAAPLVALLPFPLADNVWWLIVLMLNGLCAHRLGRRLGGSEAAGALAGVAFMLSEPVVREANLHHAPQAMLFWAPLYLDALLEVRARLAGGAPSPREVLRGSAVAGLWLAMAALTYWYMGLFLVLGTLPLLVGLPVRALGALVAPGVVLCTPALWPFLSTWGDIPLTAGEQAPAPVQLDASYSLLPEDLRFVTQHGADPLFWARRTPMDTANRLSLVLLLSAVLGARRLDRRSRWALVAMAALGAVMVLGPYLRWGEGLAAPGGTVISMPFQWLRALHPVLARLTWPERWGVLMPLALVALAARAPRPALLAALIGLESFLVSANLPLQTTSFQFRTCWRQLATTTGAILELPLDRPGLQAPRVGVHLRMHRRPVVNPVLLPPGALAPAAWKQFLDDQPLLVYLRTFEEGRWPPEPGAEAVRSLRDAGVTAIVVDAEPGGVLTEGGLNRYRAGLAKHLGKPVDLGCALVWWMDTDAPRPSPMPQAEAWRAATAAWKQDHPAPTLDTLIEPTWNAVRHQKMSQ